MPGDAGSSAGIVKWRCDGRTVERTVERDATLVGRDRFVFRTGSATAFLEGENATVIFRLTDALPSHSEARPLPSVGTKARWTDIALWPLAKPGQQEVPPKGAAE
ncbi:MAG: hypothetical protein R3C20_02995 [Planctomycetaceae bacterium]